MINETRLLNIKGVPMLVYGAPEHISDDIVNRSDFWESVIFNKWKHYFPSEGLMFDIGANIGSHTLQFNQAFPKLNIWAFEIHHSNFELLRKNTLAYPEIACFNIGVGSGTNKVSYDNGHEQNNGTVKVCSNGNNTNLVIALDNLITPEPVTFIKIDIEGHELSAFEGMKNLLINDGPMVWLEDFTGWSSKYLVDLGYKVIASEQKTSDILFKK
jgi:FkbM family methyltransferase